ncbi:MAG: DUF2513 domain-containing protein [Opitutales bacterium]
MARNSTLPHIKPTTAEAWLLLLSPNDFPDHEEAFVAFHMKLLIDAGYAQGNTFDERVQGTVKIAEGFISQVTWEGYEFLDTVRSNEVWRKTKEAVTILGGSTALSVVREIALRIVLKKIG